MPATVIIENVETTFQTAKVNFELAKGDWNYYIVSLYLYYYIVSFYLYIIILLVFFYIILLLHYVDKTAFHFTLNTKKI